MIYLTHDDGEFVIIHLIVGLRTGVCRPCVETELCLDP